jgi:hypothetical protein
MKALKALTRDGSIVTYWKVILAWLSEEELIAGSPQFELPQPKGKRMLQLESYTLLANVLTHVWNRGWERGLWIPFPICAGLLLFKMILAGANYGTLFGDGHFATHTI